MTQPEVASQGRNAARGRPLLVAVIVIGIVAVMVIKLLPSKPQLDLANSGTAPLIVQFENETHTIHPGEVWSARFRAGDTLVILASGNEGAVSRTITLEQHGPMTGSPPRVMAEVHLESPTSIAFGYTGYQ